MTVDPDRHAELLHAWVTRPRNSFWGMGWHTLEQVREIYAFVDSLPTLPRPGATGGCTGCSAPTGGSPRASPVPSSLSSHARGSNRTTRLRPDCGLDRRRRAVAHLRACGRA
ncbi:GNAT family N-acetyltransferase [Micromonospora coriariae]|uniref:GNAT family N-acetyltransferase n=1 Tax=Micromonospora coriariae TaxID=285665 RepID=UPI001E35587E|nr:GNAT family N-acetyltransferase [Micromonospora coriariae]